MPWSGWCRAGYLLHRQLQGVNYSDPITVVLGPPHTSPLCPGAQALLCGKAVPQDGDAPQILSVSIFGVM